MLYSSRKYCSYNYMYDVFINCTNLLVLQYSFAGCKCERLGFSILEAMYIYIQEEHDIHIDFHIISSGNVVDSQGKNQ